MKDSAYEIAGNPKYYWYQNGLASMVFSFFGKKTRSVAKASVNEELAQELHKLVIKNSKVVESMRDLKLKFGQQI